MIRYRDLAPPRDEAARRHIRALAGVMMAHHVRAPWWNLRLKLETYVGARSYARRSLDGVR